MKVVKSTLYRGMFFYCVIIVHFIAIPTHLLKTTADSCVSWRFKELSLQSCSKLFPQPLKMFSEKRRYKLNLG